MKSDRPPVYSKYVSSAFEKLREITGAYACARTIYHGKMVISDVPIHSFAKGFRRFNNSQLWIWRHVQRKDRCSVVAYVLLCWALAFRPPASFMELISFDSANCAVVAPIRAPCVVKRAFLSPKCAAVDLTRHWMHGRWDTGICASARRRWQRRSDIGRAVGLDRLLVFGA